MNRNKKYIIISFTVILILITSFLFLNFNNKKDLSIGIAPPINIDTIKVSLLVLDKIYDTSIKGNSSVFEVMEKIQKENINNLFNFKYTHNESLGNFITEINGKEGTPGKYWIYYVNNKKASVGVSSYMVKDGDIIKWSQEGM